MLHFKRHFPIILILLLTLLAIALVLWVFEKRLQHIEVKQKTITVIVPNQGRVSYCIVYPL